MTEIETLLQAIQHGLLLSPETFAGLDLEAVLSGRDQTEFENKWLELFNKLQDTPLTAQEASVIDRIREVAYKAAFESVSDPELSGYVSDDFEVIAKGVASRCQNEFLNGLLKAYVEGKVPGGGAVSSQVPISAMMITLRANL